MKNAILSGLLVVVGGWIYPAAGLPPPSSAPILELADGQIEVSASTTSTAPALPTVDLGYAIHRATKNKTGQYYSFSNIRYAAPPLGNLRFAEPIPPQGRNTTINDGQQAAICPQATPAWEGLEAQFIFGTNLSTLAAEQAITATTIPKVPTPGPTESEDCLFLDVITPVAVYNQAHSHAWEHKSHGNTSGAPVLVWIYGGGYVEGNKKADPGGLLAQSKLDGADGFVFVSLNYRLGMFGWLAGPTFQQEGTANLGLYDQRLALNWVQKNIRLFGGDPNRVTVMGESAGGGGILHQITAYGGLKEKAPFQQAIAQSPAWQNIPSFAQQESTFNTVLEYASYVSNSSITSLSQLRALPSSTLQAVNAIAVIRSSYGTFTFGPTVDGKFVPSLPSLLLLHGQFDQSVKVMVGHNLNETFIFTSPFLNNDSALVDYVRTTMPGITDPTIFYIANSLYPPVYNGSYGYENEMTRASLIIAESTFTCNSRYLDLAFKNETYSYFFTVPPGFHGEDTSYVFFNGDTSTSDFGLPVNATVATTFQQYLSGFVMSGNPNSGGRARPVFPLYGNDSTVLNVDLQADWKISKDSVANSRCDWWQRGLYA